MRMRFWTGALMVLVGVVGWSGELRGQVPWDAPMMVPPEAPGGLTVLLADPGWGLGVVGMWRGSGVGSPLGFRVGVAEDGRDDLSVMGGVDVSGRILSHSREFPLDLTWVSGVGIGISDGALLTVPLGLSLGRVLVSEEVRFQPYLTPRMVLDARFGDDHCPGPGDCDDLDLGLAVELGMDMALSANWLIRFAAALGDREAVAVGLAFPLAGS